MEGLGELMENSGKLGEELRGLMETQGTQTTHLGELSGELRGHLPSADRACPHIVNIAIVWRNVQIPVQIPFWGETWVHGRSVGFGERCWGGDRQLDWGG